MKKNVFLIGFLLLFMTYCDNPTTPEPPEIKYYYNIEITYIRENIVNPKEDNRIHCYISTASWHPSLPPTDQHLDSDYFDQLGDRFILKVPYRMPSNEGRNPHKISFMDWKRWDGVHSGSAIVATKIILRVVETGFELELQNIVECDIKLVPNVYKDGYAKMAQFWVTTDGKLKNYK